MSDTPKLDGQISLADHREAMRMVAVGYVLEIEAMRKERDTIGTVLDDVAALFFNEAEWDYADVHPRAAQAINELAEARRQADAISAPLAAACERFGRFDALLEMAHDPDGTEDNNPWHACARDLWRAVKAAQQAKEGGK